MKLRIRGFVSVLLVIALIALSGCGSKKTDEAMAPADGQGKAESLDSPENADVISEGRTTGPMVPVYFDFDASNIRDDQQQRIVVNGDYLKANADVKIRIEGNCDPRGTNEYNMALGERRALAAKKYLQDLGVAEERMTTISYGEERILLHGHDELSWAQNRRDDFVRVK